MKAADVTDVEHLHYFTVEVTGLAASLAQVRGRLSPAEAAPARTVRARAAKRCERFMMVFLGVKQWRRIRARR